VEECFRTVTVIDFEYEVCDGDLPNVLCMVAYVLDELTGRQFSRINLFHMKQSCIQVRTGI